jgi:uracil-DNA glycosylase
VTIHPSAILRIPDPANREAEQHRFTDDLRRAARLAHRAVRAREEETTR